MQKSFLLLILLMLVVFVRCSIDESQVISLTDNWDTTRVLANPHKGWYHHQLDNGVQKYQIEDDSVFLSFPGMDHLYLRLAWAFLEPEEGKYNWSYIDEVVEKYVPLGYGISFRISCKETGGAPYSVPQEIDGVRYATPYWVVQAGAKGVVPTEYGTPSWTPDWDDPVYLEKLENFHEAFAEKYDGKPWVRYVDVGSIGEWGEGHTFFSTRIPVSREEVIAHVDLHLKYYKKSQLVVTDDLLYYGHEDALTQELLDYVLDRGITLRDDSPLVKYYVESNLDTWSISHPHFFERSTKTMPSIFELQHYHIVVEDGNWIAKNGEDIIPEHQVSGADILRNSIRELKATYIGYHGHVERWIAENPDLTKELANLCGYWYFPVSVSLPSKLREGENTVVMEWLNKGVAPAYNKYHLKVKAENVDGKVLMETTLTTIDNKNWLSGIPYQVTFNLTMPIAVSDYTLKIMLFDPVTKRPVEIGLDESLKDMDGYYELSKSDL